MKLIYCPECHDLVRLFNGSRHCFCRKSGGQYTGKRDAVYWGHAVPVGIDWDEFMRSLRLRHAGTSSTVLLRFDAFLIPLGGCETFQTVSADPKRRKHHEEGRSKPGAGPESEGG